VLGGDGDGSADGEPLGWAGEGEAVVPFGGSCSSSSFCPPPPTGH
jgi:hypothetical protein